MINIDNEELIPFQEAGALIPGAPSLGSLHRWKSIGIQGVKLETILIGGTRFTSKQAIRRFIAAQNGIDMVSVPESEVSHVG